MGLQINFLFLVVADDGGARARVSAPEVRSAQRDRDWSIEVGSGILISDVRTDLPGYTLVPAELTASMAVDHVSDVFAKDQFWGGVFRGNTEFKFRAFGMAVAHGTESRFTGLSLGPRYNFVQPGWKVVPFVDGNIGFAFNDSQGASDARGQIGQGQDFSFQFGVSAGFRYDVSEDWFLRFSGVYTHFSNAGLSEPERKNRAIDAAGPEVAVGYRF
jgi:hypothetical protein